MTWNSSEKGASEKSRITKTEPQSKVGMTKLEKKKKTCIGWNYYMIHTRGETEKQGKKIVHGSSLLVRVSVHAVLQKLLHRFWPDTAFQSNLWCKDKESLKNSAQLFIIRKDLSRSAGMSSWTHGIRSWLLFGYYQGGYIKGSPVLHSQEKKNSVKWWDILNDKRHNI